MPHATDSKEPLLKDRLFRLRRQKGLQQKEMSELLRVETGTYRSWEKGKRTPKAMALAELERRIEALP